jgi:MFS family permease
MYGVSVGPLEDWGSARVVGSCVAGTVLLLAFVVVELRSKSPLVDLRVLHGRLFRSCSIVMFLTSAAFLGTLYLIPLYFQDVRGLSALQSGLSTFPEAFGVMIGAQLASRFIYPTFGPRRHITGGLVTLAVLLTLLTQLTVTTNLWLVRGFMFVLGIVVAQTMIPNQAASFAQISPAATGRASTFFNTMRQVGSAAGVAILSTVLIGVSSAQGATGGASASPSMSAFHDAFLAAAVFSLAGAAVAFTIHDADAAETVVPRRRVGARRATPDLATAHGDAA